MSTAWSYRLAVGTPGGTPLDWETTSEDPKPIDYTTGGVAGLVLDGATLTRRLPEAEPWPCQPDPAVLVFQVAGETATELAAQLVKGAPVAYRIGQWSTSWVLADWFTGYITEVTLDARDGYTVANVTAVDWVASLAEVVIGAEVWPIESAQDRINRVIDLVYAQAPELMPTWDYAGPDDIPVLGNHVGLASRDVDARTALDVILEVLSCWVTGYTTTEPYSWGGYGRYQWVAYHADWSDDVTAGWGGAGTFTNLLRLDGWRARSRTVADAQLPPAVFADTGHGWGVVMSPTSDTPVLDAGAVELPVRWSQRIGDIPNVSVVVVNFAGYTAGQDKYTIRWQWPYAERKPRVKIKRDVPIEMSVAPDAVYMSGVDAGFKLAFLLIPDTTNPTNSWATDDLTWTPAHEDGYRQWPFSLGENLTVTDVDPDAHPATTPWVHGQLDGYTVKVTDGFPVVAFTTRPQLRDSIHPDVITLGDLPAGVTLAELDPALTLHDTRLLRKAP